jgi:hypothetical protein
MAAFRIRLYLSVLFFLLSFFMTHLAGTPAAGDFHIMNEDSFIIKALESKSRKKTIWTDTGNPIKWKN